MLTESFIASSSAPPTFTSNSNVILKDAGVFVHTLHPQTSLKSTFKKSITEACCLAINNSYIFAAQKEKAVVHIYNRVKGNHEVTVPFPERICSLSLACTGTVLVLGLLGGSIALWELMSGRIVTTSQAHLQRVNILDVDLTSNFLLSGSADSTVLVWSLIDLLSFGAGSTTNNTPRKPRHTFSAHRNAITAIVTGHSATTANIAISASMDKSAILWNYHSNKMLRVFSLPQTPLCLTLDAADRAFYTGYDDGSIQRIDLVSTDSAQTRLSSDDASATNVAETPVSSRWAHSKTADVDAALSITLSFDSTKIISGHQSGKINSWNVSNGSRIGDIADHAGAPITNIQILPPEGLLHTSQSCTNYVKIIKPRQHEVFSGMHGGELVGSYILSSKAENQFKTRRESATEFDIMLETAGFSDELIHKSSMEFFEQDSLPVNALVDQEKDFMAFEDQSKLPSEAIQNLRDRVAHLEKLQQQSFDIVSRLSEEKKVLQDREKTSEQSRSAKIRRRQEIADDEWAELGRKTKTKRFGYDLKSDIQQSKNAGNGKSENEAGVVISHIASVNGGRAPSDAESTT